MSNGTSRVTYDFFFWLMWTLKQTTADVEVPRKAVEIVQYLGGIGVTVSETPIPALKGHATVLNVVSITLLQNGKKI